MRLIAILASTFALIAAIAWLINSPGYDSAVAMFAALAALIASFFLKREIAAGQNQVVSGSSVGIQAGRDANVKNVKN